MIQSELRLLSDIGQDIKAQTEIQLRIAVALERIADAISGSAATKLQLTLGKPVPQQ